jgi:hypothetical protein
MFGMSVFESVLERLKNEAAGEMPDVEEETADRPSPGTPRGFPSGFAGNGTRHPSVSGLQASAAYRDFEDLPPAILPEPPPTPEPEPEPELPAHLLRIAPEEIASDLALEGLETAEALLARRRTFARENHPDRAPEDLRANATLRMKIANMLIDETIRRISVEKQLGVRR